MLVTQSRRASLTASLSVREPDCTGTTLAPISVMRKQLSFWRSQSTAPMYTMHSRPSREHAAAVATPCWPAPVSAMMRFLPSFIASNAWPMALLILCAPVCASSSRFIQICAPPHCSDSRFAWYSGVGPPMKSRRRTASSSLNAGSTFHVFQAASSSLCATMRVSGMKRPPKIDPPKFHLSACFFRSARSFSSLVTRVYLTAAAVSVSGPPESSRTHRPAAATPPERISLTILEPTTHPSANSPNSSTCARCVIPKPTTIGSSSRFAPSFSAASRIDSTTLLHSATRARLTSASSLSRMPVVPSNDTTYTIPGIGFSAVSAACMIRSAPLVGDARGTRLRSLAAAAGAMMRQASSVGRSTMMKPSTPAAFAALHVSSTPAARKEL
mmetsp:Transcript_129734/g.361373  ORF Transcript_129734/g.361373 Transcript_129734/m.361373 type:complete len:385 (+) Transcript_129734:1011-2165(+)